jgi:hypothetical protein
MAGKGTMVASSKILLARDTVLSGHTAGSIVRIMLPNTPCGERRRCRFRHTPDP